MPSRNLDQWMWAEACDMLTRAERLHRQFFQPPRPAAPRPTWEPPVDVFETEDEIWVLAALPGVEAGQVEVLIDGGTLVVAGERRMPAEARSAVLHRLEIPHGRFERRLAFPGARLELARRELADGCLLLTLRKL